MKGADGVALKNSFRWCHIFSSAFFFCNVVIMGAGHDMFNIYNFFVLEKLVLFNIKTIIGS